jgi:hypothetical protein
VKYNIHKMHALNPAVQKFHYWFFSYALMQIVSFIIKLLLTCV